MLLNIARNARYARNARKKFSSKVYISSSSQSVPSFLEKIPILHYA